jgi:O-antigen ligase
MISVKPWLGYGYDAFWRGFDGPSAYVWALNPSEPPHSHNGLLDLWLSVGVAGVALVLAALAVNGLRAVRLVRGAWSFERIAPLAVLLGLVLFNITESSLVTRNSIFWILLVAAAVQLGGVRAERAAVAVPRTGGAPAPAEAVLGS